MQVLGSLRRQLMVGVLLLYVVLIAIFVFDLRARQEHFVRVESRRFAMGISEVLATNARYFLLSRDYAGLQEIVLGQQKYGNVEMAMIFDASGEILAHTDPQKIGLFVTNDPQLHVWEDRHSVAAIADIKSNDEVIGKAWVIMNQKSYSDRLQKITHNGLLYILIASLVGGGMVIIIVNAITKNLNQLIRIADAISKGERNLRLKIKSKDELAQLAGAFNSMLDSLEQKEKSLELVKTKANLANQAKSDFLASMGHEIRTPLNAVVGIADVLADTNLTEEQRKFIGIFQRAGQNLLAIVNDILDFSKIEAGELTIAQNDFSLNELFLELATLNEVNAAQKNIQLTFFLDPVLPLQLKGDVNRLRQVFQNLISNAIKFSDCGEIKISATQKTLDVQKNDIDIEFSVQDHGIGIKPEEQYKLFQRFLQIDNSSTRKFGGTGLGLAISKRLIELMGGNIHCISQEGQGSLFYFNLPFSVAAADEKELESSLTNVSQNRDSIECSKVGKILLADDNEDNRLLIKAFLKNHMVEITECENGQEAVNLFIENNYDLILLDMQMPILDGYHAVKMMREWEAKKDPVKKNFRRAKVVAITADAVPDLVQKALNAGCDAHIAKPLRKKRLLEIMDSLSISERNMKP